MIKFSRQALRTRLAQPLAYALVAGLLVVALPAAGSMSRVKVHFNAMFNATSGNSTTPDRVLMAEVGTFETTSPELFNVIFNMLGQGFLLVDGLGPSNEESSLRCLLDPPVDGAPKANASVMVTPKSDSGQLTVRASDDGSTPMIDVEWTRGGEITVNEVPVMLYELGVTYTIIWNFTDPMIGPTSVSTKIEGSDGSNVEVQTILSGQSLRIDMIEIVVPSSGSWGEFQIDNIRVMSVNTGELQSLDQSF